MVEEKDIVVGGTVGLFAHQVVDGKQYKSDCPNLEAFPIPTITM